MSSSAASSPARWRRIKEIFEQVIDLAPAARDALLQALTEGEPDLQVEVLAMIAADKSSELTPTELPFFLREAATSSLIGTTLGRYRLEREIGRGGMGSVFLGVRNDGTFDKRVAVKVIRRGLDSDAVVARFASERRILAHLDHPNIAALLDGGATPDGLPYFVMEWVDGVALDEYCRQNTCTVAQKLALFSDVCRAVQHAHRNLTIHRDLKPANILVTGDGRVKLVDFGIAKLLDAAADDSMQTANDARALTPAYASPEHLAGLPATTASDVYSLGVVLYELLCSERPYRFESGNSAAVLRILETSKPESPSQILRKKRGTTSGLDIDLDRIAMKAIAIDPHLRYSSAQELLDDLERYRTGMPVLARGGNVMYRAAKFVKRNAIPLAVSALAFAGIATGLLIAGQQAGIAERERELTRQRTAEVRQLVQSLLFDLDRQLQPLNGSAAARLSLVRSALQSIDHVAATAGPDPDLQAEVAAAYNAVGSHTFDTRASFDAHETALTILRNVIATGQARAHESQLIESLIDMADSYKIQENFHQAEVTSQEAITRSALRARSGREEDLALLETAWLERAQILEEAGSMSATLAAAEKARSLAALLVSKKPNDPRYGRRLATTYGLVAVASAVAGRIPAAADAAQQELDTAETMVALEPGSAVVRRLLWDARRRKGLVLVTAGNYAEAIRLLEEADAVIAALSAGDRFDTGFQRVRNVTLLDLANAYRAAGRLPDAIAAALAAQKSSRELINADPARAESAKDLLRADHLLAELAPASPSTAEEIRRLSRDLELAHKS